jgi:RNA polymerase sigma factor (sigma-70 family)
VITVRANPGLLKRAQDGDRTALERLFCIHLPLLTRWARSRAPTSVRRGDGTDDLVQRVILNTLRRLKHLDPALESQLQAYLRRSLINLIRDDYRRAQRAPPLVALDDAMPTGVPSPLTRTIARRELRDYEAAVSRLRPAARDAIVGRFELGLSYEELAAALGRPSPDAARLVLSRAMVALLREMRRPSRHAAKRRR